MHRGFNLNFNDISISSYTESGERINNRYGTIVKRALDDFLSNRGSLDGSRLQEHWFPQIKADVFISHSHRDKDIATALAGWMHETFDLEPFIDSCVWGYADELLKSIDDRYCRNPGGDTYSYEKRNGSTSHVHMMLSTALGMMIDNTECLFFLNTPNSITSDEAISRTQSPWLFSEIAMTHIVRRKKPQEHRELIELTKSLRKSVEASLKIEYEVKTASLTTISLPTLKDWKIKYKEQRGHALDVLYKVAPHRN